jgi:hypothetical protein
MTTNHSINRRGFLKSALGSVTALAACEALPCSADIEPDRIQFHVKRTTPTRKYDGKICWCHPRAGIVPGIGKDGGPRVVMTMNTLDVSGSDVFKNVYGMTTDDRGRHWTSPQELTALAPRAVSIDDQVRPVAISDCWPTWHAATQTLLATGHTVVYTPDWKVTHPRPRHTAYTTYDASSNSWESWRTLKMPVGPRFNDAGAGCSQRCDEPDGSILLPIYFRPPGENSRVIVTRCNFNGHELTYLEEGNELSIDDDTRGLHEPSLTCFQGQYYLTIRNDKKGFVTRSRDGLRFEPIQPWKWDDGSELGSYNTQQHWVRHQHGLFLVYTRRGAQNDHVFRHRAPLFMAQVDPSSLRVLRATEQVVVPERGARLGNFGVTEVSQDETWITVAEWMQTWGPNHILPVDNPYGSDGSVWVAQIRWA